MGLSDTLANVGYVQAEVKKRDVRFLGSFETWHGLTASQISDEHPDQNDYVVIFDGSTIPDPSIPELSDGG
jgi:hypothetical protein